MQQNRVVIEIYDEHEPPEKHIQSREIANFCLLRHNTETVLNPVSVR